VRVHCQHSVSGETYVAGAKRAGDTGCGRMPHEEESRTSGRRSVDDTWSRADLKHVHSQSTDCTGYKEADSDDYDLEVN
jgi:hypothetical protein